MSPAFNKVTLTLSPQLVAGTIYTASAANVKDCTGNIISDNNTARFGLSASADSLDLVINEILFHLNPGGADYIELYNRSQKIIDLSKINIANRNSAGAISSIYPASLDHLLLFPQSFAVLTTDTGAVIRQYFTSDPRTFIQLTNLPSYPDDVGNVIILTTSVIDEVAYSDKWHFPLITNTQGVSLERIDYNAPSVQSNFHSAATSVGYGTPGYKNSQFRIDLQAQGEITVTPEVFSPDNDGTDDFAMINYKMSELGYVANITIYDAAGRPVKLLAKNATLPGESRSEKPADAPRCGAI